MANLSLVVVSSNIYVSTIDMFAKVFSVDVGMKSLVAYDTTPPKRKFILVISEFLE